MENKKLRFQALCIFHILSQDSRANASNCITLGKKNLRLQASSDHYLWEKRWGQAPQLPLAIHKGTLGLQASNFLQKHNQNLRPSTPHIRNKKKKPKAPRPWFFFASQNVGQGRTTYIPTTKMKKQTWGTKPQVFFVSWGASQGWALHTYNKNGKKKTMSTKLGFSYFLRQKVWSNTLHTRNKNERKTWGTKPQVFFNSQGKKQGWVSHTPIGKMKIKNWGAKP